ncbi:uncharacterized protein LOC113205561 isoform X2 [Frankliniella occidentalis]|uniref:Uncharacterized protein LOC113205561 isoform X2 n=1 Tax=Frankliniella occidentalis TaxID=133901 RepID=A0A9C6XDD2_FRAOC|nr:uncharacterized protein LOC113205561 isoform X2 [Frankliniella occidentalis]
MFVRWFDSSSGDGSSADEHAGGGGSGLAWCSCTCSTTLALTVLATACSTALLVCAVITDHWEHVAWDWDRERVARVEQTLLQDQRNGSHHWRLDWLVDGKVARLLRRRPRQPDVGPSAGPAVFLLPMNGGIWTLCANVNEEQHAALRAAGLSQPSCVNYLTRNPGPDGRPSWQRRMQNLSISCALVCLIILGSSAIVGAFGVVAHQASAVLVTGVLYFLAATFALFTLSIIHFKRAQTPAALGRGSGALAVDGVMPGITPVDVGAGPAGLAAAAVLPPPPLWGPLLAARRVETAWSLQMGWGGVAGALLTAALWLTLSRAMRGPPPP